MNLRFRLNLIVTLVLLVILTGSAIKAIQDARESVRAEVESTMELAMLMLSTQLSNLRLPTRVLNRQKSSPFQLKRLTDIRHLNIQYFDANDNLVESSETHFSAEDSSVPEWFRQLMHDGADMIPVKELPVYINTTPLGRLVVSPQPDNEIEEVWEETQNMLSMATLFFVMVNVLVYLVVAQALKPITRITSALSDIEVGNLETRLPIFKLPELAMISEKFNLMATALERSTKDNHRLTQQIIHLQEAERKSIAQELHDEIGQHITAIHLDANAIKRCEKLAVAKKSAEAIDSLAAQMVGILRSVLQRLRPGGLDDLGFIDALHVLLSNWQDRHPTIEFNYQISGSFSALSEAVQLTLYRVIQESLTNISRHANANKVDMFLDEDNSMIMLIIKDDGKGFDLTQHISNFGLAGMKERVDSVDGQIEIDTQAGEGVALTITIPKLREQE